jgi:hypothetical protein
MAGSMTETTFAKTLFLAFFGLIAVGVLMQPRAYVYQGAPSQARWRDLRLWALFLVAIHAVVYWWF